VVANALDGSRLGFITVPYNHPGTAPESSTTVTGASIVLWLRLNTLMGLPGKKFYRFAIDKSAVIPAGGLLELTNFATIVTALAPWTATLMSTLSANLIDLLVGKYHDKVVQSITLAGATNNKPSHKYFDTTRPG
jgi:hypothetical protein